MKPPTHLLQGNNRVIVKVGEPDDDVSLLSPCLRLDGSRALEHLRADVVVLQGLLHVPLVKGKSVKGQARRKGSHSAVPGALPS